MEEVRSAAGAVKAKYLYAADGTKQRSSDYTASNAYDYLGSLTLVKSGSVTTTEAAFAEGIIRDGNVLFFEKDHLGSVRVVIDRDGDVLEQNDYYPFGMRHENSNYATSGNNRFRFNGKEHQTISTIDALDYGARMYDQQIGRWFTGLLRV